MTDSVHEIVLTVQITDQRPGAWCDNCLLPSASDIDAELVQEDTGEHCGTMAMMYCPDCGHQRPRTHPQPSI